MQCMIASIILYSIDLLVMGEDDVMVSRLLCYGSQFAHRNVLHSHQTELTGCFRREDNNHFIDGKIILVCACTYIQYVCICEYYSITNHNSYYV